MEKELINVPTLNITMKVRQDEKWKKFWSIEYLEIEKNILVMVTQYMKQRGNL